METQNNHPENLLSDLIRVNSERIELYEKAARETNDPELRVLFTNIANESRKFKNELLTEVDKNGNDTPEQAGVGPTDNLESQAS